MNWDGLTLTATVPDNSIPDPIIG